MIPGPVNEIAVADRIIRGDLNSEGFSWDDVPTYVGTTLVDLGLTTFDSLTPDDWWQPTTTYDWLTEKGYVDAARFYQENEQAVKLGSLVGGALIGGFGTGLVMNALRLGRLGSMAANPWTRFQNGALKNRDEMLKLVGKGQTATQEYRNLRRGMRNQQMLNGLVEGLSYETAFLATMNQHQWMQDYNLPMFALGTGLGGLFGGPVKYFIIKRGLEQEGRALQTSQVINAAKGEDLTATREMAGLNQPLERAMQRAARMNRQQEAISESTPETFGAQWFDRQLQMDKINLVDDFQLAMDKTLRPKGKKFRAQEIGSDEIIGTPQAELIDNLVNYAVNHPTKVAMDGVKGITPWKKPLSLDHYFGRPLRSEADVRQLHWDVKGQDLRTEQAIFDMRTGERGSIVSQEAAMMNLRAADVPAYASGKLNHSPKWTNTNRDLWTEGDGLYTAQGTVSADIGYYDKLVAKITGAKDPSSGKVVVSLQGKDIPALNRMRLEDMNKYSVVVDGQRLGTTDEIFQKMIQEKANLAYRFRREGYLNEQVATMLNMPERSVAELAAAGFRTDAPLTKGWTVYNSTRKPELRGWLSQKKVAFTGDDLAQQNLERMKPAALMDRQERHAAQQSIIDAVFTNPSVGKVPSLFYDKFIGGEGMGELITQAQQFITRMGIGTRTYATADQSLRELGHLEGIATSTGTLLRDTTNKVTSDLATGLMPIVREIQRDRNQSILFEQMFNAMSGLNGKAVRKTTWRPNEGHIFVGEQPLTVNGSPLVIPADSSTGRFLTEWMRPADGANATLADMRNATKKLKGAGRLEPKEEAAGIHLPYMNLQNKFVGYIMDPDNIDSSRVFLANTESELEELARHARSALTGNQRVVLRGDKANWEYIHNYNTEVGGLSRYSTNQVKVGIAREGVSARGAVLDDIMQGMQTEIQHGAKSMFKNAHPELFDQLQQIHNFYAVGRHSSNQGLAQSLKRNQPGQDAGTILYNTLLNNSGMQDFPLMHTMNNGFEVLMNRALNVLNNLGLRTRDKLTEVVDFDEVESSLRAQGIPNPYRDVEDFIQQNYVPYKDLSADVTNAATALMATTNLRLLELAHAGVTLLSAPIVMTGNLVNSRINPLRHMLNGIKYQFGTDDFSRLVRDRASDHGFLNVKDKLWEQSNAYAASIQENSVRKMLDSKLVNTLSAPSDWSEKATRQWAYFTGISQAVEKDPGMVQRMLQRGREGELDLGEHFAHSWTIRNMGNYNGTQRPLLFQGQLGQIMSTYQTYMLTMGQNMFRFMEEGDRLATTALLGTQATTFGLHSLPGYDWMNTYTREYVLRDDMNFTNFLHRNFGNEDPESVNFAEYILYGWPSAMMNAALSPRAELQPRLPLTFGQEGSIGLIPPMVSQGYQLWQMAGQQASDVINVLQSGGGVTDYGAAGLRALAMQSMWRPGRGLAELAQGYTLDRNGSVVENDSFQEFMNLTRALGVRPLKEHVLRQTRYQNRYYDAMDSENRAGAIRRVKEMAIRPDAGYDIGNVAARYFENGGTSRGWNALLNRSYLEANLGLGERIRKEVAGQPLLDAIADDYIF